MYNEILKKEYLKNYENRQIGIQIDYYFRSIEWYEEKLNKDLFNFSITEIIDYYKTYNTPSYELFQSMNNVFKLYTEWALQQTLVIDSQNHYEEINMEIIATFVNIKKVRKKFVTRADIYNYIKNECANDVDAYMVLALFEGIRGVNYKDLYYSKPSDFDRETLSFKSVSGKVYHVSDKLIDLANSSAQKYIYHMNGKSYELNPDDSKCIKNRIDTRVVSDDDDALLARMSKKVARLRRASGHLWLDSKALIESGRIEYIKSLMEQDETDNLSETILRYRDDIEDRYGIIPSIKSYIIKYGSYYKEE